MGWRTGRTVVRGMVLGGALLATLTVVGALAQGRRHGPEPAGAAASPAPSGPLTATQPELRKALLTGLDLPGYTPRAQRGGGTSRGRDEGEPPGTGCAALVERPWEVTGERVGERTEIGDGQGLLTQTVTLLTGADRDAPVDRVARTAEDCREFAAAFEDGPTVRVSTSAVDVQGRGYALRFGASGGKSRYGFVAVFRVGPVLSVLRRVDTRPVTDAEVLRTLRLASARLSDATDLFHPVGN